MTTRMDPVAFSLTSLGYSEACSILPWAIPWYVDGRWLPGCHCQPECIYFTLLMRLACFLIGMPRWGDYLGLPRRVVKISLNSNRKFHRAVSRNGSSYHLLNACYMPMTLYLHLICVKILTTLQMWKTEERLRKLPKIMQLISDWAGVWIQVSLAYSGPLVGDTEWGKGVFGKVSPSASTAFFFLCCNSSLKFHFLHFSLSW